ncbi:MAG: hypothetical protein CMH53_07565, partial [Myxococcales bacterium]|nr:hypothetical protein [Myxococcales bacterium]
ECSILLARLDPSYQRYLDKPLSHVDPSLVFGTEAEQTAEPTAAPSPSGQSLPVPSPNWGSSSPTLTVGSLFKQQQ